MASSNPTGVTIRSYQVGFGDCFLLTFHYPKENRFALVDFGTNGTPDGNDKEQLLRIAKDIQQQCGSHLHVVVATHRHKDHISGFSTDGSQSPGGIIRQCHPDVVIQPWTEDPRAATNAEQATKTRVKNFTAALSSMHAFSGRALRETGALRALNPPALRELSFVGQTNLANKSAVQNLMKMGKVNFYVNTGFRLKLGKVLPGVKVWVLGPPTLKQSEGIKKEARDNPNEFWLSQANFWKKSSVSSALGLPLFRNAMSNRRLPLAPRWFVEKVADARTDELLGLVRNLDNAMNNTSVILLLEVNGKRILLSGDAQLENWSYALGQKRFTRLLRSVALYKVGHHGSRNATPMSLWNLFKNRKRTKSARRLKSMVSTMAGKYGKTPETEVPRSTLITALKAQTRFSTTQSLGAQLYYDETI